MAAAAQSPRMSSSADAVFGYEQAKVSQLVRTANLVQNSDHPTEEEVKMFNKCMVSALAAMKMLKHSLKGVKKGQSTGELSREVMGLLIGKPEGNTIYVTDCVALPVEGEANFVSSSDKIQALQAEMIDSMELRRNDRFVGWYHSHPFDVEENDHCFLSVTDVQTQQVSQFNSSPWTAIVVDPLRSLAKAKPILGCFRTYPIKYEPPKHVGPDGKDVGARNWGPAPNRYYKLEHDFFMSGSSRRLVEIMSRNNLWVRVLSSSLEPENQQALPDRLEKASQKINSSVQDPDYHFVMGRRKRDDYKKAVSQHVEQSEQLLKELKEESAAQPPGAVMAAPKPLANQELVEAACVAGEAVLELLAAQIGQMSKNFLFNNGKKLE